MAKKKILSDDQILQSCQNMVSEGIKLTGAFLRARLLSDYGVACDNGNLYRVLNQFRNSLKSDLKDSDDDFSFVPRGRKSSSTRNSYNSTNQQSFYYFPFCFFNSEVNISNITIDSSSSSDLVKEIENLKTLLEDFITRFDTIPSNGSLSLNKGSKNGVSVNL